MAKDDDKEPGFWRGFAWGVFTPMLLSGGVFAITFVAAVVAGRRPPGSTLFNQDDDIPPPEREPIDVEAS